MVLARRCADTAADGSERIGRARCEICLLILALRYQLDVTTGIGVHRTCSLAGNQLLEEISVRDFDLIFRFVWLHHDSPSASRFLGSGSVPKTCENTVLKTYKNTYIATC